MNNTIRRIVVIAAIVVGAGLVLFIGNTVLARGGGPFNWSNMMGWNGGNGNNQSAAMGMSSMMGYAGAAPSGMGMMDSGAMQPMMGNTSMMGYTGTLSSGMGAMMTSGMMSDTASHQPGMMMGFGSSALLGVKPLSVEQATNAVNDYLAKLGNKDLTLAEVMIFDNNAYARITEKSTGAGAFELLMNPATLAVYPEPGPNMMWNTKYGHMRSGMMGGMMGNATREATTSMPVSASDALKKTQAYLDQNLPGAKTAEDADTFYGYYTIDILRDGKVTGMLSVNGYTGQVFVHTWHGNFIEMNEGE